MHQDDDNSKELNYVAKLILQTFKDTGLDNAYIQDGVTPVSTAGTKDSKVKG